MTATLNDITNLICKQRVFIRDITGSNLYNGPVKSIPTSIQKRLVTALRCNDWKTIDITVDENDYHASTDFDELIEWAKNADYGYYIILRQLRALWTAYCIRHDYQCDTASYDSDILALWNIVSNSPTFPHNDETIRQFIADFDTFDSYMGQDLS